MIRFLAAIIICGCVLCACADRDAKMVDTAQKAPCDHLFVILPGNFVIDLAAGSDVVLNPAVQEFVLFCSPAKARESMYKTYGAGAADWHVYAVQGEFSDIVQYIGNEPYLLKRPARVYDLEEDPS